MTWRDTIRTATEAVRTHRLRSALTMLGILIGITAVVLTVGLGAGAKAKVQDQINELGTNVLVVSPGSSTSTSGTRGGFGSASTLTRQDAAALSSPVTAPDVQTAAPASTTSAALRAGSTNWTTTLTGTTPAWSEVRSRGVSTGRFITADDEANAAPVVVLGPDTVTQLFGGNPNAVGQTVSYNGVSLQVVGVLDSLSSSENASNNDLAVVPLSAYQQRLVGGANRNSVSSIDVKATFVRPALGRVPGGERTPAQHTPRDEPAERGLLHRDAAVDPAGRNLGRQHIDRDARGHRGDCAPRRRDRRDEHHARVRRRADA